jgi:hypothetical protein
LVSIQNSEFRIQNSKFKILSTSQGFSEVVLTMEVRIFLILEACARRFSALSGLRMPESRANRSR